MKKICNRIQTLMADNGPESLRDDSMAQDHLTECPECFDFLEALARIHETLSDTSAIDAPDEIVEALLDRVGSLNKVEDGIAIHYVPFRGKLSRMVRRIATATGGCVSTFMSMLYGFRRGIAYGFVVVMVCGITASLIAPKLMFVGDQKKMRPDYNDVHKGMGSDMNRELAESTAEPLVESRKILDRKPAVPSPVFRDSLEKKTELGFVRKKAKQKIRANGDNRALKKDFASGEGARHEYALSITSTDERSTESDEVSDADLSVLIEEEEASDVKSSRVEIFESVESPAEVVVSDLELKERGVKIKSQVRPGFFNERKPATMYGKAGKAREMTDDFDGFNDKVADTLLGSVRESKDNINSSGKRILENFLNERAVLENVTFKKAEGYWANTYLPGDPMYRWLDSRLSQWDRTQLLSSMDNPLKLDGHARRMTQPFDPPVNAALGVYLHADRRGVQDKTRMLVQVGIKGTPRFSGSRPAMNVGIVLDLRGDISKENFTCFKALLTAFGEARDLGDRFSLILAGKSGGVVIKPGDFTYGHLSVTMKHLLGDDAATGTTFGVVDAVRRATELVSSGDDPTAPLGSSEVILVTSQSLGGLVNAIAERAHKSSVGGVPVSVIGIGSQVKPDELNQIIYSGQGNRRLFEQPQDAPRVVTQELTAVSRVIARAVRLRIRLARGVQLVDVLDSHRLDENRAQKVRDAEKSIDQRMAKNLGIKADRGEDEDGIQIVIPSFYAGDTHVVILDVVVSGPGPIADVTVRYKDLVKLKNSVARVNLSLDRTTALAGPLERNVQKNLLARMLSETLTLAGEALASGDDGRARDLLRIRHELLKAVQSHLPGFQRDRDIVGDIALLHDYLAVLDQGIAVFPNQRSYLADSLKFAGKLKVLPRLND